MRLFVSLLACFTYVTGNSVAPNKWCDGSKGEAGGTAKEYARGCVKFDLETMKLTFRNELPECLAINPNPPDDSKVSAENVVTELPLSLRDVYCNIFKRVDLAKSGIKRKDRKIVTINGNKTKTEYETHAYLHDSIVGRLGNKGTYDPYSLKEANFKFSVNRYWRECEYKTDPNNDTIVMEGVEVDDWFNCVNRTHMANWMKYYLVSQFNPGNGLNIDPDLKESDFLDGNTINPNGKTGVNPERKIMITLDEADGDGVNDDEKDVFGTTLLELCFYSYDAKAAVRHQQFRQLCRKEFKRRCHKAAIEKRKINLFYCDRITDADLMGFLTQLTAQVVHEKMSNKIHLD